MRNYKDNCLEIESEVEKCHSLVKIKEDKHNVISISFFCAIFKLQHVHG